MTDALGRIVLSQQVSKSASVIEVNTKNLSEGVYLYRLENNNLQGATQKLEVIH
jgi:hypothetical protein